MTRIRPGELLRRLPGAVVALLVVSALVFLATEAAPGDAATARLGATATPDQVTALRHELGLDRPAAARFVTWLAGAVRGDFGVSYASGRSVAGLVAERAAASALLGLIAIALLVPLSLALGIWAGLRAGRPADRVVSMLSLGMVSVPEFVTGALLMLLFAVWLGVLPAVSLLPAGASPLSHPEVLVLPVATLLLVSLAQNVRLLRAGVAEATASDAAETARLNGVPERRVVARLILPLAVVPALPVLARHASYLLGGTLIVETLFAYPGLAAALVDAVASRDVPVVQACALLGAAVTVAINLGADVLHMLLDPRRGEAA